MKQKNRQKFYCWFWSITMFIIISLWKNIKQLITDIKSGCASAHLREMKYNNLDIHIYLDDLPKYVKKGLIFYKNHVPELKFISHNCLYRFSKEFVEK